jgi:hypothetical protein
MDDRPPTRDRRSDREPRMGEPGWYPDHTEERRADFARTTPADRVLEAIELSRVVTTLSATSRRR